MQVEPAKIVPAMSRFKLKPKLKFTLYDSDQLQTYFSNFRLHCYLLLLISPIGLGISAFLFTDSFSTDSIGVGILLFLIGLFLILPWTLVPTLFLFTTTRPKTWQRKVSWGYIGALVVALANWVYYFS